jgi:hypothetical protein
MIRKRLLATGVFQRHREEQTTGRDPVRPGGRRRRGQGPVGPRVATIALNVEPEKSSAPAVFTFSDFGLKSDITLAPAADVIDNDDPEVLIRTLLS